MEKPASPDKIAHRTRFSSRKDSGSELAPPPLLKRPKQSDYIAPPLRRLGPYQHLSQPVPSAEVTGPVDFGLQKAVGLVVKSARPNAGFSSEFLQELTNLTSEYMGQLFRLLHELTEVQRHHRPGIADLEMCLAQHNLSAGILGREYDRTVAVSPDVKRHSVFLSNQVDAMLREYYAENYHLDKDDPSLVFHANEQYEVAALVPRQSKKRTYIPSYLPDLPPDFTYQYTGNYMKTLTDLKEIKLKLVDESRLNEASLYKLIDDDSKAWSIGSDIESDQDDIMSEVESVSEVESPIHEKEAEKALPDPEAAAEPAALPKPDKKFDFVAYARSRQLAKQRRARKIETRRNKRHHNVFMRAERVFSCYADGSSSASDREYISSTLQRGFKKVIQATRRAEQEKKKRITELLALKAKAEQEHEQSNAIEFGFAFNHASSLSDSDDDDEPKEFDFGDQEFDFGEEAQEEPHVEKATAQEKEGEEEAEEDKQNVSAQENHVSHRDTDTIKEDFDFGDDGLFGKLPDAGAHVPFEMEHDSDSGNLDRLGDIDHMDTELDSALNAGDTASPDAAATANDTAGSDQWQTGAKTEEQDDSDEDELEDL